MRLLSLDQSSRNTGYAIFNDGVLENSGVIKLTQKNLGERLSKLRDKIACLIEDNEIDYVVFEDIQLQGNATNNVSTFKILAEVFGVLEEYLYEINIPHQAIAPPTWKAGLHIFFRNRVKEKKAAQEIVANTYNKNVSEDESDAICIGTYFLKDKSN